MFKRGGRRPDERGQIHVSHKVGSISGSISDAEPMPADAKQLADLLTVPIKPGTYQYGQPAKLVTFKGVTYTPGREQAEVNGPPRYRRRTGGASQDSPPFCFIVPPGGIHPMRLPPCPTQSRQRPFSFRGVGSLAAVLVALASASAGAQEQLLWGDLKPGPHAVGYQALYKLDPSREYDPEYVTDATQPLVHSPRPILICMWYPARATGAEPITYRQYLEIPSNDAELRPIRPAAHPPPAGRRLRRDDGQVTEKR